MSEKNKSASLGELYPKAGKFVRDVAATGKALDITDHGYTIARIIPANNPRINLSEQQKEEPKGS